MMNGIQNTKGNDYQVAVKMAKTHSKEQLEQMYEKAQQGKDRAQAGQGGHGKGPGGPGGGPGGPGGPGGAGNSRQSGEAEAGKKPEVVKKALEIKQQDETSISGDAIQSNNDGGNSGNLEAFGMNLQAFAGNMS